MPEGTAYTPEFVEHEYNNRARVPDHPQWLATMAERSAAAYAAASPKRDLRYGSNPKETLDLFLPTGSPRGTFVFLHGGYWRALDKADFGFVAPPLLAHGIAVAVVNYDLCPAVSVADIVDECRRAIMWIVRDGAAHGAVPDHVVVGGHSAGGHLAAMLVATDWRAQGLAQNPLAGAVSLSGVHDLRPMVQFSFNADLKLDEAEATRLSPALMRAAHPTPLVIAVGGDETSEFVRQARILWDAWPDNRPLYQPAPLVIPQRHHFSVVLDHGDPASALTAATLGLFDQA